LEAGVVAAAAAAARATAAAAAGTAAADEEAVQQLLLPELLDCWLELMHQLLLQKYVSKRQLEALLQQQWPNYPHQKQAAQQLLPTLMYTGLPGLLFQVRNTARVWPLDSRIARDLLGAGSCGCAADDTRFGDSSSSGSSDSSSTSRGTSNSSSSSSSE
jgi:hypothetical protein